MYYAGEGVEEDEIEAYKWFFISGELGNANGGENRQIVGKSMRSGDVLKAGKLARAWLREFEKSSPGL